MRCYIALGSNLNQPVEQLKNALRALGSLPQTKLLQFSAFYHSKPLGPQDQPDYINAVACIDTNLAPLVLLDHLQHIENEQGRVRLRRWGERTLDLDILLYGDLQINTPRLTIPHYDMYNRNFVMLPLAEIAADLLLPNQLKVEQIAQKYNNQHDCLQKFTISLE